MSAYQCQIKTTDPMYPYCDEWGSIMGVAFGPFNQTPSFIVMFASGRLDYLPIYVEEEKRHWLYQFRG